MNTFAQVKVTQGDNSPNFAVNKQTTFTSFYTDKLNYFVIKHVEEFEKMNTLIVADKNGHIITDKDVRINRVCSIIHPALKIYWLLILRR